MPPRPASALAGLVGEASAEAEANNDAAEAALERMMEYLRQRRELAFDMLKRIDKDNNGNIDHAELAEALRRMGVRLPSVQLRKLFRMFDTDDSGTIEIKEFTELLSATTSNNNLKKLQGRKQHANRTSQRMARSRTQPLCAPSALSSSALSADQNSAQADSVVQHSSSDPVPHARSAIADAAMRPTSALSVTWSGSESKRVEMERDALQLEFDMAVEWGETAVLQPSELSKNVETSLHPQTDSSYLPRYSSKSMPVEPTEKSGVELSQFVGISNSDELNQDLDAFEAKLGSRKLNVNAGVQLKTALQNLERSDFATPK